MVTAPDGVVYFARAAGLFPAPRTLGFGDRIALAGHMQKDLWRAPVGVEARYLEGLAFSSFLRTLSCTVGDVLRLLRAGALEQPGWRRLYLAFSPDGAVLAALYVHFGSLPWIQGHVLRKSGAA